MTKIEEIEELIADLVHLGMNRKLARKNLLETDREFISELKKVIKKCLIKQI